MSGNQASEAPQVGKASGEGSLLAVIGDEDTVTGFLLAGIGNVDMRKHKNFLVVTDKTPVRQVEETFKDFTNRDDMAIILINQHIANMIRHLLRGYDKPIPAVLEVPSKEHPYNPAQDSILERVKGLFGGDMSQAGGI